MHSMEGDIKAVYGDLTALINAGEVDLTRRGAAFPHAAIQLNKPAAA